MPENYRRRQDESHVAGHEHRRLGRHVNHDPRSRAFPHLASGRTLVSKQHKRWIPVLDQGDTGSCTGNAMDGAAGTSPLYEALPTPRPPLDEGYARDTLYHLATSLDGYQGTYPPDDTGSDGLSVAKGAKQLGLISGYTHAFSLADALDALQDGPVLTGVDWYEGFDTPDATGLVKISGAVRGGHEFVVDEIDVESQVVWFPNSWGTSWGVNGRACMSFDTWGKLLASDGDATILVPANAPAPQPVPTPVPGAATFLDADPVLAARVDHAAAMSHEDRTAWLLHHLRTYFRLET